MNWEKFQRVYHNLFLTHYSQPEDAGHRQGTEDSIEWLVANSGGISSVIDMGSGEGYAQEIFEKHGVFSYIGIALGGDVEVARSKGRNVVSCDFNLLPDDFPVADCVMARHSLEHSLCPHITLSLWRDFASRYIFLVLPSLEWFKAGIKGSNHFSVLDFEQWKAVFSHADLKIKNSEIIFKKGRPDKVAPNDETPYEYWFLLEI